MTISSAETLQALSKLELPDSVDLPKLIAWMQAADELDAAKVRELEQRQLLITELFPELKAGTNNLALGEGFVLKAVLRVYYNLDTDKTKGALDKLRATGEVGALLAERVVKWSPELRISEYFKLDTKQRGYFRTALTTKPGQAALELVAPKG